MVVIPNYKSNSSTHCPNFTTITSATIPILHPWSIATNGTYIYVTNGFVQQVKSGVVFVFDPARSGKQTPVATLQGAASRLDDPHDIAVGF